MSDPPIRRSGFGTFWIGLDLGCGHGESACESAKRYPDRSFLGVDHSETACGEEGSTLEVRPSWMSHSKLLMFPERPDISARVVWEEIR